MSLECRCITWVGLFDKGIELRLQCIPQATLQVYASAQESSKQRVEEQRLAAQAQALYGQLLSQQQHALGKNVEQVTQDSAVHTSGGGVSYGRQRRATLHGQAGEGSLVEAGSSSVVIEEAASVNGRLKESGPDGQRLVSSCIGAGTVPRSDAAVQSSAAVTPALPSALHDVAQSSGWSIRGLLSLPGRCVGWRVEARPHLSSSFLHLLHVGTAALRYRLCMSFDKTASICRSAA